MKHSLVRTVGTLALVLGLAGVAQAQGKRCEISGLAGSWAYTESGTIVTPSGTPVTAAVGRYTFDRDGTFTAIQWTSTLGQPIGYDTKDGTYTVNEDCTITMTITGYRDGTEVRHSVWWIVLADNGKEIRGISLFLEALVPNVGWVKLGPVMTMTGTRVSGRGEEREQRDQR
jgi:hypothetical protein